MVENKRLSPTEAHETLDHMGVLDESQGSGCYALRLKTPDTYDEVRDHWDAYFEGRPDSSDLHDLADGERVAYVGASSNVYDRIMDHAEGEKRKSAYLKVFPPVDVVDVWPTEVPFQEEYNRGVFLAKNGWATITDGEVLSYE